MIHELLTVSKVMSSSSFYLEKTRKSGWRRFFLGRRHEIEAIHLGLFLLRRELFYLNAHARGLSAKVVLSHAPKFVAPVHYYTTMRHGPAEVSALQEIEFLRAEIRTHAVNVRSAQ